ncbi:glycoside hydrolase family 61 protein [Stachybotrys elegans]|uniref:lytic cellulose monooxygenase (C4-dehydrogenating) n=1 Tax=Stachybotrys elegans TaxID=80388 RepID=A0A8K0WTS3_9HYPO|nr:glycoside hydrolase family 61 protein [Stachybotrys elegans]
MQLLSTLLAALAASEVSAHYIFQRLDIGGTTGGVYEGIRQNSNYNSPVTDLTSTDLRCNVGATNNGASTAVRSARAGDRFTFYLDTAVYHQGPVSVFVSKAPSSVQSYTGDGTWAKIADIGPTFNGGSASWNLAQSYSFTLPSCLPDGEYLLKISQLGIHNPWPAGIPQFYTSCAQIRVTGGTNTGRFNPTLRIPGAFSSSESGYTANIYSPDFRSYTVPGGAVFTC